MTNNNTKNLLTDETLLTHLGDRVRQLRLRKNLSQTTLAEQSGVAKRTIERFENGASIQLTSLIRILRALDMLDQLLNLIPEQTNSPMQQLLNEGKKRYRASKKTPPKTTTPPKWQWDE